MIVSLEHPTGPLAETDDIVGCFRVLDLIRGVPEDIKRRKVAVEARGKMLMREVVDYVEVTENRLILIVLSYLRIEENVLDTFNGSTILLHLGRENAIRMAHDRDLVFFAKFGSEVPYKSFDTGISGLGDGISERRN